MPTVIKTQNKKDIDTGFDITFNQDMVSYIESGLARSGSSFLRDNARALAEQYYRGSLRGGAYIVEQLQDLIGDATEIFIEEASLSRWSGNMIDNSVIGISGKMPKANGNRVSVDVRIGVNTKAIKTGNGRWTARPSRRLDSRNKYGGVVYEYGGYRMHPGVDYSKFLDEGTARIPNSAAWAGFVKRAEDRFNAL